VNIVGYDFLPTFADIAGATASLPKAVDGVSFKPLLLSQRVPESYVNRQIYFHYPHYRESAPSSAIVIGQMKLLYFYDHPGQYYTYDLSKDLAEKSNISTLYPENAKLMYKQLMDALNSVGAYFPKPNSAADPNTKVYDPNSFSESNAVLSNDQ
jgi:arylsulfatase A-like enzyme